MDVELPVLRSQAQFMKQEGGQRFKADALNKEKSVHLGTDSLMIHHWMN